MFILHFSFMLISILIISSEMGQTECLEFIDGCSSSINLESDENGRSVNITIINCESSSREPRKINLMALNESKQEDNNKLSVLKTDGLRFFIEFNSIWDRLNTIFMFELLEYTMARMIEVNFNRVKRINAESPASTFSSRSFDEIEVSFMNSALVYVDNLGRAIRTCDEFERLNSTWNHFFYSDLTTASVSSFILFFENVNIGRPVCELAFKNSQITSLDLGNVYETFFKSNQMRFIEQNKVENLNSNIKFLIFEAFEMHLDLRMINRKVFGNLVDVTFGGLLSSIQDDLFTYFDQLTSINLNYANFERLARRQGIKWIRNINANLNVDLSNSSDVENNSASIFVILLEESRNTRLHGGFDSFSRDENFCIYVDWPFEQLVWIKLEPTSLNRNLSCLTFWLLKQYPALRNVTSQLGFIDDIDFNQFSKCDLSRRVALCNKSHFDHQNETKIKATSFNSLEFLVFSEFLVIVATSVASLSGIITNLFVVLILVNKKFKKEFEKKHYTYMLIFSVLNILSCLLQLLTLINECQQPFGIICPTIRIFLSSQYFKLVSGEFFLHFFILMSNCTYVAFALCRLSLVGINKEQKKSFLKFVSDLSVWKLMGVIVIFSCSLAIVKPFRFTIRHFQDNILKEYPAFFFADESFESIKAAIFKLIFITNILYEFVNYCVFVFINMAIDLVMLKRVRQVMCEREDKMREQIRAIRDKQKKEDKLSFRVLVKFVMLNSLANIGLKIPVCVMSLNDFRIIVFSFNFSLFSKQPFVTDPFVFPYTMGYLCDLVKACQVFQSFGHFLYFVSFSINFFFLKRFDSNFRNAFSKLFEKNNNNNNKQATK